MEHTTMIEFFKAMRESQTFEWFPHMEITNVDPGHSEVTFHTKPEAHANGMGNLHGAVYVGFSDALMGLACFTLGKNVTTLQVQGNYVKGFKAGGDLRGVARVEHNGGRTMVVSCRMYNDFAELVYMGSATFFVLGPLELPELPWRKEEIE